MRCGTQVESKCLVLPSLTHCKTTPALPGDCSRLSTLTRMLTLKLKLSNKQWKPWLQQGGGRGQPPTGATLSPTEVQEWAGLPIEVFDKTKGALSRSSRTKVENDRRAAAAGTAIWQLQL